MDDSSSADENSINSSKNTINSSQNSLNSSENSVISLEDSINFHENSLNSPENSSNSEEFQDIYNEEDEPVELSSINEEIDDDDDNNSNVTRRSSSLSYEERESTSACNTDFEESRSTEDVEQAIEILEENNNDPNNNMDIENVENIIENDNNLPIIEMPASPKPGCSRDFDFLENSQTSETELHKKITEIQEFLGNITYVKIRELIRKNENFKRDLFQLFGDASLKRDGDGDICDVERKKITVQITSVDGQMEIEGTKEEAPVPEALLDGVGGVKEDGQELTPPQQEAKRTYVKNSTPISLDSSSDEEAVVFSDMKTKENGEKRKLGNSGQQNHLVKVTPPKEMKMPKFGQVYKTTLTNGHSALIKVPFTASESTRTVPSTIVRKAQANFIMASTSATRNGGLPAGIYVASTSQGSKTATSAATSTVTTATAAAGNPGTLEISKNSVDGEPVQKIKIITQGKTSRVVPADNLVQPPRIHRPAPIDDPRRLPGKHQPERWNPVFLQHDNPFDYQANVRNLNKAFTEARLQNDLTLTLREEADREIAETLNFKYKNERKNHQDYDFPILHPGKFKYPTNHGKVESPPRPGRDFLLPALPLPDRILPQPIHPDIPIFNLDEAQIEPKAQKKEKKDGYCQEIYTKLRAMFPNIKKDYIKNITPAEWAKNIGHDVQFGQIVERLLAAEATWELEVPDDGPNDLAGAVGGAAADANPRTIDETYEQLLEIFPKADPTYLRTHAERVYNNDQAYQEFIEQTSKKHDYPTREQYLSQMRTTEERLSYTQNFTVQGFLEKFPDPFKHFLDSKRKCQYDLMVFEFLKCHFNRIRVNTISKIYNDSGWNMSIAASKLSKIGSDMSSTRKGTDMPPKDINLLQEMAFVRNQKAIKEHIAKMEQAEKMEFEELKKSNGLLECQCCYDTECMPSKCSTCENGHIFCNSCIVNGTDSRLGEGETHVACFQACGSEFSLATLQKILKPAKFSILVKKRQAAEVAAAGLEGLVACPFCHFASIPPEGDKVFKCLNLECMKESCIQCKEPNHVPLRCDEVGKADKARKYIEEKMTQALARNCYKCNRAYFKEEGCNKITCPCGAIMCYLCNKKIKDYSHFRGQGSDDMSKCPLYSDNARLNAENVRRVADEAKKELLRQDPALNIDTERLLPNVPPPSTGPHQQILQAPLRLPMPNLNQVINQVINQRPAAQDPRYRHHHHRHYN